MKRSLLLSLAVLIVCASAALAADPVITSVSPSTLTRTWIGDLTITGSDFQSGAQVYICGGITGATNGSCTFPTTFVSSTEIKAYTRVSSGAILGPARVIVTNPDSGVGTLESAVTVTAAGLEPSIHTLYFDGVTYESGMKVSRRPSVTGKITDSTGLSSSTVDLKILIDNIVTYDNLSAHVSIDATDNTKADFGYTPSVEFVGTGLRYLFINVKDSAGNPGEAVCLLDVQEPLPTPQIRLEEPALPTKTVHNPTAADPIGIQYKLSDDTGVEVVILGSAPVARARVTGLAGYNKVWWDGGTQIVAAQTQAAAASVFQANGSHGHRARDGLFLGLLIVNGRVVGTAKFVKYSGGFTP